MKGSHSAMLIIGLTGNIATGKSTVGRLLQGLGAEVLDADEVAHTTMEPGTPVWEAVRRAFGPEVIAPDGTIDRHRLGAIVFADPIALKRLEGIVHPAVREAVAGWLRALEQRPQPPPAAVVEAVKLLEGGLGGLCDSVWLVVAPRQVQVDRLVQTRGHTPAEAALRIDAQPPVEPRRALADIVIENSGSLTELEQQVREAWRQTVGAP